MRKATAISAGLHAAVLLWATLSFSGKSFDVTPAESLPVDFISEKDFSEMTKGVKDAPKVETPVIQSQDLEHQPDPATRVSNKGVKITPHLDEGDTRDFAREDEDAVRAMEELEKQYREQLPG